MPIDAALLAEYEAEAHTTFIEDVSQADLPFAPSHPSSKKRKRAPDDNSEDPDEEFSEDESIAGNDNRSLLSVTIDKGPQESSSSQTKYINRNLIAYAK